MRLSQELGRNGADATRRLFWRASLTWGGISCLIAAGLFLLLPLFRWIYGPQNIPSTTLVLLLGLLMAKQGFTVSLGSIFLIMDRVALNALVKLPLMLVWLPLGALLVQRWGAEGAAAYQLGAYLTGDLVYFGHPAHPLVLALPPRDQVAPEPGAERGRQVKVLHVSPLLFGPEGVVGGGERYPWSWPWPWPASARRAWSPSASPGDALSPLPRRRLRLPVRVYRPPRYLGTKGLSPVAPQLVAEIARADVVHCHQLHTFLADQCVLIGRLLRKPVFLTDHAGGDRNFNRRLRTWERATGLLLVSDFNAREFARFGSRVAIIHGGVDPHRFAPRPVPRRRRALYAGRLIPYKGIQFLIQGVAPETEVRLAGPRYHEDYERHLREVAAGRNVRFARPRAGRRPAPGVLPGRGPRPALGRRRPLRQALPQERDPGPGAAGGDGLRDAGGLLPSRRHAGAGGGRRDRDARPAGRRPALGAAVEALLDDPAWRAAWGGRAGSTSWPTSPGSASPSAASAAYRTPLQRCARTTDPAAILGQRLDVLRASPRRQPGRARRRR